MDVLKRSEFCGGKVVEESISRKLGTISHGTTFRANINGQSGIWFKAYVGAVLIVPGKVTSIPVLYASSVGKNVVDYEVLNATLVIDD